MSLTWVGVKAAAKTGAFWVKVGVAAVLAIALFVGGCNYGESNRAQEVADQSIVIADLNREMVTLREANATYEADVGEANKQAQANRTFAEEQMKEAEEAAKRARKSEQELLKAEQKWKREFSDAMNNEGCAELMRMKVCSIAPLP